MTSSAERWNRAQDCDWLGRSFARPINILFLIFVLVFGQAIVSTANALDKTNSVADGELRACQIVTVDNAWAVGDRGLILSTGDSGKHWEVQHQRSDAILYGVCFSDELNGCVVGGTIEPYSHRSVGVVLATSDGGKSWQSYANELPRLVGAQLVNAGHILAWGDWSNHYQSALFESTDGGHSWAGRPIPCGHIQCAAVGLDGLLVVVDRAGKIHRSRSGLEYESVDLPVTPFDPVRFCKVIEGTWWIGGDAGKLYRSSDAVHWEQLALPGTINDQSMISLADAVGHGNRIWIAGQPGNVVWTSEDLGKTWAVVTTSNRNAIHSISVLNGDLLLSCGPMANLFASRNGGKAWWAQHQSGTRSAVLNISSTCSGVAWDLMTHVVYESKRHASALVLHDQCFEERTSPLPELASRFEIAGKTIGLAQSRVLASLPAGNLYSGIRESDLGYYAEPSTENANGLSTGADVSPMLRRIAFEIRNARPDVIITNCRVTGNALEVKSANAVEQAAALAGRKDFKVFSASSGILEEAWEPQKIMVRTTNSGMHYSPSMLMESNVVLGSVMTSIRPLLETRGSEDSSDKKFSYRIAGTRNGLIRDLPLKGVVLDQATQLTERQKNSPRLATVTATSAWFDWKQFTKSDSGNPLTPDRIWDSNLRSAANNVSELSISPVLMDVAIQCRRSGDWNRWQAALEFLLERDNQSPVAEAARWELMMHTGSIEVKRVLAHQLQTLEKRNLDGLNNSVSTLQQASPFAKVQPDSSSVQLASFSNSIRRIPISTNRDLNEFTRLLSKWPDSFASRRTDPRWGWLIASRYREMQQRNESANATVNLGRSYADFWPVLSPYLADWNRITKAERQVFNTKSAPEQLSSLQRSQPPAPLANSIPVLTRTINRPFLDGIGDEAFWELATQVELRDPWSTQTASKTLIKFARDEQFLYVFSHAPTSTVTRVNKEKQRDHIKPESDQIKLRIDLDRDYASWFEVGWSASGETHDSLNEMLFWNPTWYVATSHDDNSWSAEIAIPLEQLVVASDASAKDWANEVWALNAIRTIPNAATHSMAPSISDRSAADDWFLLDLSVAKH